jgi:Domain of unknown function (DUF397)
MEDTNLMWRKATYSSNGGASCVEVGSDTSAVMVRDTTDREGPMLAFGAGAWERFTGSLR